MENKEKLFDLVNQLKNLFCYSSGVLTYNYEFQNKVNVLMTELGNITGTFDSTIKKEISNIKDDLTIVDSVTGEHKELVDVISMADRVKNINHQNNIYSCLKTLALSNKIAHVYDGEITKIKNKFISLYNAVFPEQAINDVTFIENLNVSFSNLVGINKYNFDNISDKLFIKMWNILSNPNTNVKKKEKISILSSLKIDFDKRSDVDIDNKFVELCNDSTSVASSYLIKKFKEGQEYVNFENKMFAIKDFYISMIGQLLCKNELQDVDYQLVTTPDAIPGFEYMLIIDDKDLSYYIEVHMPNFIAMDLIRTYGMEVSSERRFKKLGATAIYYRDEDEIKSIYKKIQENSIDNTRAEIITRGYSDPSMVGVTQSEREISDTRPSSPDGEEKKSDNSDYVFFTTEISDTPSLFERFLSSYDEFGEFVNQLNLNRHNETISIHEINYINNQQCSYIYDNFPNDLKLKFTNYYLDKLIKGDAFDKKLYIKISSVISKDNIDDIAKIIINLNSIKYDFANNNKKLNNYLKTITKDKLYNDSFNDYKYIIDEFICNYIDKTFEDLNIIKTKKRK